jgi:2-polyprenyl-6-methoxyphenol hydroxylase-like FAD-dependent oxidoreductase
MRHDHPVLIAGAGPTGLAMAIELKRLGLPVRIIDTAEHAARHSQALVVQARTLEQFERYGIADEAVARGRKMLRASLVSDGKTIICFDLDRIPGRYPFVLFFPQNETERLLTEHLNSLGCEVERGTELLSFENTKDGVTAQLRHKSGATQSVSARWLIGCDGAHSVVRKGMKVAFEGDTVGLDFFLGDFELAGPDVPGDELRIHLRHGEVVFIGRLSDKLLRVIVTMQRAAGALPANRESDLPAAGRQPTLADFQAAIDRTGAQITVKSSVWMTPFHINQRKAAHYRVDSAFLAGDASHIHSPVAGQGMNTGIQDTANLAWKLAAVADGAGIELLDTYDEERGAVGDALLKTTSRGLAAVTSTNPLIEHLRDFLAPAITSLEPVRQIMAGFVSETGIEYRDSSIVADYGGEGSLRAGDRAPNGDVEFAGGQFGRLLDQLKSGRALVLGIGVEDMRKIRVRLPHADVLELRSTEGMLGTEIKGDPDSSAHEDSGYHSVSSEFPAAAAASAATAASAAALFSAAGVARTYASPPSVSKGRICSVALLTPEIAELFGSENRIVIIRPDGYLGFRGSLDDLSRLDDYARLTGLV